MYDEKNESQSDSVTEKRYRRLSYQLFGEANFCKGPFIDLNKNSTNQGLPHVSKKIRRKKAIKRSPTKNYNRKNFERCLICYSDSTRMALLDDEGKKESYEHLIEFLGIIRSHNTTTLNGIMEELNDDYSTSFEQSVKQLVTMSSCLCGPCNAACQKLVKIHRTMIKLEQELKELQVKFLNAIKLSKAIAEKYDKDIGKTNKVEKEEDHPRKTTLDMESMVNQIRTYLIGGKGTWSSIKDKWMDYVHLDNEFTGNCKCKHLHEPNRSNSEIQNKGKPKRRKEKLLKTSKIDSQSSSGTSLAKIIIVENDKVLPTEIKNGTGFEPGTQRDGIETSSIDNVMTRGNSSFDCDNDDFAGASFPSDNEDSVKLECDSLEHGQLNEETLNAECNETSIAIDREEASDDDNLLGEKGRTTADSTVKCKKTYHCPDGVANSLSLVHKPLDQLPSTSYRRLRTKNPNTSIKKHSRPRKNLPPGRARIPIEELKSTSRNKPYIKWRESHYGKTMSIPAYKKMRRELALKRQKILDEEGTFMPGPTDSILPVRWVEKEGKLTYLGFEVNKHEDANMSCTLCPDFKTEYKNTMSRHIKQNHIEGTKTLTCAQCDAKFIWRSKLKKHIQEKHGGGYQCDICGLTLFDRSGLYNHVRFKHDGDRPHVCEHCGKGFGRKKDMTIHVRRHTGERPFVCHVCANTFVDKQSMKKHIRIKHPGEPTDG